MKYNLDQALEILQRTPEVLQALLDGLSEEWLLSNEGPETFSPYDVVGHLVHGEKTDWPGRIAMILQYGAAKTFVPYDRFAMYQESKGKSIQQLLNEFYTFRQQNIDWVKSLNLNDEMLDKKGLHPSLGEVTLRQLMATWVIHDLTHLAQIARVMAKQYKEDMGPWIEYFRLMNY